jgi:predicted RNA-binding protein YlqC (UPF0109 family)
MNPLKMTSEVEKMPNGFDSLEFQELLYDMIVNLVSSEDAVEVRTANTAHKTIFTVELDPTEMGKVIGTKGLIYQSLSTYFKALGSKHKRMIEIEVIPRERISC